MTHLRIGRAARWSAVLALCVGIVSIPSDAAAQRGAAGRAGAGVKGPVGGVGGVGGVNRAAVVVPGGYGGRYYGGYGGYGYGGYGYGGYGGGTVAGSYYNGLGNALQGAGQYNLDTAQAETELQRARQLQIDNHVRQTEAYFQLREINRQQKALTEGPKHTPEDWARINRAPRAPRLSSAEYDPSTGVLKWPLILDTSELAPLREQVQAVMSHRASFGSINGDDYAALTNSLEELKANLKSKIDTIPSGDYMKARRFLEAIDAEATTPDAK